MNATIVTLMLSAGELERKNLNVFVMLGTQGMAMSAMVSLLYFVAR